MASAVILLGVGHNVSFAQEFASVASVGLLEQLTDNEADDVEPSWSPDGNTIAFASHRPGNFEIHVIDLAISGIFQITGNGTYNRHPDWSWDGQLISYTSGPASDQIRVIAPNGTGETVVTVSGPHSHPDWSPDADEFVYTAAVATEGPINRMNSDGSGSPFTVASSGWYADWSPEGHRIAFARHLDGQIYLVDPTGGNLKNISISGEYHACPAWSPDGSMIACSITRDGSSEIFIIDTLGSELLQVTSSPSSSDVNPTWSPLQDAIAFESNRSGNSDIWKVEICCSGIRGNANGDIDENINISDITYLVDYLFGIPLGPRPPCISEGNANGDEHNDINISDITYLVDYLFGIPLGPAPPPCP